MLPCVHLSYVVCLQVYSWLSLCVLMGSIMALIMSTHLTLRDIPPEEQLQHRIDNYNLTRTFNRLYRSSHPQQWVIFIEYITIAFFLVELIIKVICCCCCCHGNCSPRWQRLLTFTTALDVLIVLPTILLFAIFKVVGMEAILTNPKIDLTKMVLESLRCLRVFRLYRVIQQVRPLQIIIVAMKASRKELLILIALVSVMSIIWGTIIFYTEILTDTFYGIGYGMWWALVTMTTVGYGDYFPKSGFGYIVGTLCALSGILILALPIPVIANNFNAYYRWYTFIERINERQMMKAAQCSQEKSEKPREVITNDMIQNEKMIVTDM